MSKSKRAKPTTFESRAEFDAAIADAAALDTLIKSIEARCELAVIKLKARYGEKLEPFEKQLKAQLALCEKYADEHRAEILPDEKERKSAEIATATFGYAEGKRAVKTLHDFNDAEAIVCLEDARLAAYVRTEKEINRQKILDDCKDDKTLRRPVLDPAGHEVMVDGAVVTEEVKLSTAGLRISKPETFWVKAKTESATAMRTEAAA